MSVRVDQLNAQIASNKFQISTPKTSIDNSLYFTGSEPSDHTASTNEYNSSNFETNIQINHVKQGVVNPIQLEIEKRNKERNLIKEIKRPVVTNINTNSTVDEVRGFLSAKGFSDRFFRNFNLNLFLYEIYLISIIYRVVLMFGELNGIQMFSLKKSDFEKFCGKEEGARLDSQIRIQKSLCGVYIYKF